MFDYGGLAPQYVDQLKGFEGYNPKAYGDYKQTSIGYGTKAQYPGEVIDRSEAESRLNAELGKASGYVGQSYSGQQPMPDGVRAALTSLTYNAGPGWMNSGLGAAVKAGDWDTAKQHFAQYVNAGGQPSPALAARRQKELAWWDGGNTASDAQPAMASAFADQKQQNMNPIQQQFAQQQQDPNAGQYAYAPQYDQNAGLFDRLKQGGPGALFGAPGGVLPGANGRPGYDLGNRMQRAALFGLAINNPSALGALGAVNAENAKKFVQIGTDPYGNPKYGFVDEHSGTVIPSGGAGAGSNNNSGDMAQQGMNVSAAINKGLTGDELLKQVDPGMANRVKLIHSGQISYNQQAEDRTPYGRMLNTVLASYDPNYSLQTYEGWSNGMKDWAGGKSNETTRRAGQAIQHAMSTAQQMGNLDNGQIPALNAAKNYVTEQLGGGTPGAAREGVTSLANEMGAFVRGNGGSDSSFNEWAKNFPINGSPEQQKASMGMLGTLFKESMGELEQKRLRAIGPMNAQRQGPLLSPDAQKALNGLEAYARGGTPNARATALPQGVNSIKLVQ